MDFLSPGCCLILPHGHNYALSYSYERVDMFYYYRYDHQLEKENVCQHK